VVFRADSVYAAGVKIDYLIGDATLPPGSDPKVIVHCVNNIGAWGAGFVIALSKRWPIAEDAYRTWAKTHSGKLGEVADATGSFELGEVQFVLVGPKLWVANLVGQNGVGKDAAGRAPIRYDAIRTGFQKVARFSLAHSATVHMPRLGAGLAGGRWEAIEQLVKSEVTSRNVAVKVYDLPVSA
jgi:O-acetyl-ADP-ribose deacetylase (regulator of RNase III)